MAQTIRTKKTHRDIKALDKTMTAAERMKNTYVRAKDSAGQARGGEEQGSPVEYAEDSVLEEYDGNVLSKLIDKVYIYGDGNLQIVFKNDDYFRTVCVEE